MPLVQPCHATPSDELREGHLAEARVRGQLPDSQLRLRKQERGARLLAEIVPQY